MSDIGLRPQTSLKNNGMADSHCYTAERLHSMLIAQGFDGDCSVIDRPKDVLDGCMKVLARRRDGTAGGVFLWSNPNVPDASMAAAQAAARAREVLGDDLGQVILRPIASGVIEGCSYVLWPWQQPISSWRLFGHVQARWLRTHLFNWLTAVVRRTVSQPDSVQGTFEEALRHIAEHPHLGSEHRQIAERAIVRLNTKWSPHHILSHNDFWLGNILLKPEHVWTNAAKGEFTVIDWGAAALEGYPIYDLVRLGRSLHVSRGSLKREIHLHCNLLDCGLEDAVGYLAAALGHLGLRNDHFPLDRYVGLVNWCFDYLQATMR